MELSPYQADPFFDRLLMRGRQRRAMSTQSKLQDISVPTAEETAGSESQPVDLNAGVGITTPVSSVSPANVNVSPTYGTTPEYGLAMRAGEAVGTNLGALTASVKYGTLDPLKGAGIGTAIDAVLGDVPDYLSRPSSEGGVRTQIGGFDPTKSYGQFPDGRIAEVTAEDIATGGFKNLTAAEAARMSPMGYVGADPRTPLGQVGMGVQALASSVVPFAGMMFGKVVESPIGTPIAMGSSPFSPGVVDRMYETHGNMMNGIPGNFGMKVGNGYVTYNAANNYIGGDFGKALGLKESQTAGRNMSTQQFQSIYGVNSGFDPRTVDWENSKPGQLQGDPLAGFVKGKGGFAEDGNFFKANGTKEYSPSLDDVRDYANAALSDSATAREAIEALEQKAELAKSDVFFGESKHKAYKEVAAELRSNLSQAVANTQAAYPGRQTTRTGPTSVADVLLEGLTADTMVDTTVDTDIGLGITDTGKVQTASGFYSIGPDADVDSGKSGMRYDPATGNYYNFNLDQQSKAKPGEVYFDDGGDTYGGSFTQDTSGISSRSSDYTPSSAADRRGDTDRDTGGDRDASGDTSGGYGSDPSGGASGSPFAQGGFVEKKAEGGQAVGPVGFVNGKGPSQVSDQKTIADDVEGAVPEGTFVINAAAVERAGEKYIVKLLMDALDYLRKRGVDISATVPKMDTEEAVSVAVSEGEVLVPPAVARVIGYDRLEKINNRGKKEVARRQAEGQEPQQQSQVLSKSGGFISKPS